MGCPYSQPSYHPVAQAIQNNYAPIQSPPRRAALPSTRKSELDAKKRNTSLFDSSVEELRQKQRELPWWMWNSLEYCVCIHCQKTRERMNKGVWLHDFGGFRRLQQLVDEYGKEVPTRSFFTVDFGPDELHPGPKPKQCIWFSAGSWLFDNEAHGSEVHEETDEASLFESRVIQIESPHNVVKLSTLQDVRDFEQKYAVDETRKEIDWRRVKEDGYFGVMTTFRKISHLSLNEKDDIGNWHSGWDVESLAVWDFRALPETFKVGDVLV